MITRRGFFGFTAAFAASCGSAKANEVVTVFAPGPRVSDKVANLARSLSTANLSVIGVPGYGPMQNLAQLLDQRDVRVPVLQSDLLDYLQGRQPRSDAAESLRYIAQLYIAPVHILAQQDTASVMQLAGQKVSFGLQDSVSYVTASRLFSLLGLSVQPQLMDDSEAVRRLRQRELAALIYAGEVPARMFSDLNRQQDAVRFVPLMLTPRLSRNYLPAQLSIQNYPLLIGEGEAGSGVPVPTIGVPMLLAVYNWPQGSPAHRTLSHFAAEVTRAEPISLEAPGWRKFVPDTGSRPLAGKPNNQPEQLTVEQRETLFKDYENWRKQRQRESLFEDYLRSLQGGRQSP